MRILVGLVMVALVAACASRPPAAPICDDAATDFGNHDALFDQVADMGAFVDDAVDSSPDVPMVVPSDGGFIFLPICRVEEGWGWTTWCPTKWNGLDCLAGCQVLGPDAAWIVLMPECLLREADRNLARCVISCAECR